MADVNPADEMKDLVETVPPETDELAGDIVDNDDLGEEGNDRAQPEDSASSPASESDPGPAGSPEPEHGPQT